MKQEQWRQIERIHNSALELGPGEREAFLERACAGDAGLRKEVERLLARGPEAEDFIERPALEVAARVLANDLGAEPVSDLSGTSLSHYRIIEKIGSGGMGVVYRAEDTNLNRQVAIKLLPEMFSGDPERLARFEREARLLASLNHPNVAAIYGLERAEGKRFLAMELVEGETLAQRIGKGPLPVDEALEVCRQIAEGLEAAHEKGVIHRDLKPANVKITPEGKVKVLDFGLAKAFQGEMAAADTSHSPTLTNQMTRPGVILGTAAYMSPEQARGKPVDKRTDIWAFGCVLYEALTGRRTFRGDSVTEVMAKILEAEPDWSLLPPACPAVVRALLRRCLQKDRKRRQQDILDVRLEIEEATGSLAEQQGKPVGLRKTKWWLLAFAAGCIITVLAIWRIQPDVLRSKPGVSSQSIPIARSIIPLESGLRLTGGHWNEEKYGLLRPSRTAMAFSPDGSYLVYSAAGEKGPQLYLRRLNEASAQPLSGTEGGVCPFYSPDGQWIGYYAEGKLKKMRAAGGPPQTIYDMNADFPKGVRPPFGVSWGQNDVIVFAPGLTGLRRVSASGGKAEVLTKPDRVRGEHSHLLPHFLPDGRTLLFTVFGDANAIDGKIALLSQETGVPRMLVEDGMDGRYAPSGHLVFMRRGMLMAAPFNSGRLQLTGDALPAVESVMHAVNAPAALINTGAGQFSFSASGSLIYVGGGMLPDLNRSLLWVDHNEGTQSATSLTAYFSMPRFSPDRQTIAYVTFGLQQSLWSYDVARGVPTRLTVEGIVGWSCWTPDSKHLAFGLAKRSGEPVNIWWLPVDGSFPAERLTTSTSSQFPSSWSPDGKFLLFVTRSDIEVLRIEDRRTEQFLSTNAVEAWPDFSPDGRWIAYGSDESGRQEVYVRPFPGPGAKYQVSTSGGCRPAWSRDGRRLFYRSMGESPNLMWVADVTTTPDFRAGAPRILFDASAYITGAVVRHYDVSAGGERFLMVTRGEQKPQPVTEMTLVLNWFEELKRLVPTGGK